MKGTLTRTALAAGGMMVTSAVMAGSLALPTAQSLAGQWQVADSERQCQIEFLANEQSETNGYQLVDRQRCLQSVFAAEVVGWRLAPGAGRHRPAAGGWQHAGVLLARRRSVSQSAGRR
nr:AprI/Inh family metalloprotease inhibitor [Serratia sp. CC22-02]